jgi:Rrf2 family protein
MKISKRGEYALRALIDIGIASHHGQALVRIGELAEYEKLPVKFLEQILMQLKGGGFVSSKRGKAGGYYLRKAPQEITFGSVIRLIDGPLAPISCVSVTAYERCSCPDETHCGLRMLMLDVRNAIANILDKYTLADVVSLSLGSMKREKLVHPFIQRIVRHQPQLTEPAVPTRLAAKAKGTSAKLKAKPMVDSKALPKPNQKPNSINTPKKRAL